jgi:hypothetical protein
MGLKSLAEFAGIRLDKTHSVLFLLLALLRALLAFQPALLAVVAYC